ncbi:hypothetical protein [Spongiibacter tropicus]|uniref:hypothetical protein n=1 Tax=Spongiibacter tropicus TaxID=454602 RepID=UPI00235263C5|nr:hypothetical protein [Spongiibacter tropicus]|tara:strand:+ start:456 stop:866 length:411 start_codon:yes stop_codon:yes gene_type:complete
MPIDLEKNIYVQTRLLPKIAHFLFGEKGKEELSYRKRRGLKKGEVQAEALSLFLKEFDVKRTEILYPPRIVNAVNMNIRVTRDTHTKLEALALEIAKERAVYNISLSAILNTALVRYYAKAREELGLEVDIELTAG